MHLRAHASPVTLQLKADSAQLIQGVLNATARQRLMDVLADQPADKAGVRLFAVKGLDAFVGPEGMTWTATCRSRASSSSAPVISTLSATARFEPMRNSAFDLNLLRRHPLPVFFELRGVNTVLVGRITHGTSLVVFAHPLFLITYFTAA
jgi:hypothetical protein